MVSLGLSHETAILGSVKRWMDAVRGEHDRGKNLR
jgi:hypothetical protein